MAQKYYFFNSAPGDERIHQASDFARYFGNVLTSGLFSLDNQIGLRVRSDGTDMRSYVEIGKALIKGFAYENDADEYLLHDLPEVANNRIDRVVLRLDLRNQNRFIKVFVKSGVTAEEPVPPTLQRDNFIFELSLARIVVRANTSTINPADITDERLDEQLCGVVNSMITVPTSQFQDDWNDWYAANIPQYESEWQDFINGLAGATFVQTVNGTGPDVNGNVEVAVDTTGIDAELDAMSAQIGILSGLNTTNKTNLVNAVNELFTFANDGKTKWSSVIGSPLLSSDTFTQMQSKTQTIKNTLATNLTAKGQSSVGTETLTALADKVANVETGKKFATGTVTATSNGTITLSGLAFSPTIVMVRNSNALAFLTTSANQIYADTTYNLRGAYVRYGTTNADSLRVGTGYNDTLTSTGFTCRISSVPNQTLTYTAIG
ncbi:carbohydrate-binding CenC domain protein [Exiguobacterium sp. S17]|nr:carbohydrate-binding CenC domain protein [Exiguobacterium sp. S17]